MILPSRDENQSRKFFFSTNTSQTPNTSNSNPSPTDSPPFNFNSDPKVVEDKRQKFWEFWTEESEAIKAGKEFIPKPLPIPKETSFSIWKFLAFVLFMDCMYTAFRERQIDEKEMTSLAEKKLEEVFDRIKPFVILQGGDQLPSKVTLKLDSRRWTIHAEDRYLSFIIRVFDEKPTSFSFTFNERYFSANGNLTLNILKDDEHGELKDLDLPMKCWVTVQRSGRTVRLESLTLEFLKGGKKVSIPTEVKPVEERALQLVAVPFKP